jgi:hypothetical protein
LPVDIETGSTTAPNDWDQSTDTLAIVQGKPKPAGGVVIKAWGHRFAIPTLTILGACLSAGVGAYQVVTTYADSYRERIRVVEERIAELEQARKIDQAVLVQIQTSLARIDARVAEIQVTLMRRR